MYVYAPALGGTPPCGVGGGVMLGNMLEVCICMHMYVYV